MANLTAFAMWSMAQDKKTDEWKTMLRFGWWPDKSAAVDWADRVAGEAMPEPQYYSRWTATVPLPREYFEEFLAQVGDIRTLRDLKEEMPENVLDDGFLADCWDGDFDK